MFTFIERSFTTFMLQETLTKCVYQANSERVYQFD